MMRLKRFFHVASPFNRKRARGIFTLPLVRFSRAFLRIRDPSTHLYADNQAMIKTKIRARVFDV